MGVPQNGWLIRENPVKMDDLGVLPFMETPMYVDSWLQIGQMKSFDWCNSVTIRATQQQGFLNTARLIGSVPSLLDQELGHYPSAILCNWDNDSKDNPGS